MPQGLGRFGFTGLKKNGIFLNHIMQFNQHNESFFIGPTPSGPKNAERAGVTVEKSSLSHWPDLSVTEKSSQRNFTQLSLKHIGVVIEFPI